MIVRFNPTYDLFFLSDRAEFVSLQNEVSIADAQVSHLLRACAGYKNGLLDQVIVWNFAEQSNVPPEKMMSLWSLLIQEQVWVLDTQPPDRLDWHIAENCSGLPIFQHFPVFNKTGKCYGLGFRFGPLYLLAKLSKPRQQKLLAKRLIEWAFAGVWLDRARPLFWNTGEVVIPGENFIEHDTCKWLASTIVSLLAEDECLCEISVRERTVNWIDVGNWHYCGPFGSVVQQSVITDLSTGFSPSVAIVMSRYRQKGQWDGRRNPVASGAHRDRLTAHLVSSAEALERHAAGKYNTHGLEYGSLHGSKNRIDPDSLYHLTGSQCEDAELRPFKPDCKYYWRNAISVITGQEVRILADLCYYPFQPHSYKQRCRWANSSGMAAGMSVAKAQFSALLELIERDAFMKTWIFRQPPSRLSECMIPRDLVAECDKVRSLGYQVDFLDISKTIVPTMLVVLRRNNWPAMICGAAARNTVQEALLSAWKEAEVGLFCRLLDPAMHMEEKPRIALQDVRTPDDHACWFNNPENLVSASFLWSSTTFSESELTKPCFSEEVVESADVVKVCRQLGVDALYSVAYGEVQGLRVVRLLSPWFVPLTFGFNQLPHTRVVEVKDVPLRFSVHPLD